MPVKWIPKRLVELSLINIASRSGQLLVDSCEAEYRQRIEDAADTLLRGGQHLVMLTGPSSSGKTTTSHKLAEALRRRGKLAQVISLDDFFLDPENYPRLPDGTKDYENVTALDIPLVRECLAQVVATGETMLPQFDFPTERRLPQRKQLSIGDGVLIVEGIHAHNPCLTDGLPQDKLCKIYAGLREEYSHLGQRVISTRELRCARRMVRDYKFRGHTPIKTLEMWPGVLAGEDKYIKVFKPSADLLLDTSFSYEVQCLAPRVLALAKEFPEARELQRLAGWFGLCAVPLESLRPADSMLQEFLG